MVSAKSVATGKFFAAVTNSDGIYSIRDLTGGDYQVSGVAGELLAPPIKLTLAAAQTTDLTMNTAPRPPARPRSLASPLQAEISRAIRMYLSFLRLEECKQSLACN